MRSQHKSGSWYLALNKSAKTLNCRQRQPKSSGTEYDGHEEDDVRSWEKCWNLIISHTPKMKNITPYNVLKPLPKSTDDEGYDMCWDPHTAVGNLMKKPEHNFRKQHLDPWYIRTIPGHSGARSPPNFFSQQILEVDHAKNLHHICARITVAIKIKGRQAVHLMLVNPVAKDTQPQISRPTHFFLSHHDEIYVVDMEACRRGPLVLPNAQRLHCLFRHDRQGVQQEKSSTSGTEQKITPGFAKFGQRGRKWQHR